MMSYMTLLKTVMGPETVLSAERRVGIERRTPVTPAIVRGWQPKTENTNAAMNEESKTSATPYWSVVSMRSREKAMPGKTL